MRILPIYYQFSDEESANQALDTLEELGFDVHLYTGDNNPAIGIILHGEDLTSALEISQAHGGRLIEYDQESSDEQWFASAYDLDHAVIPAHLTTEDLVE
jgi:hypothetical protein